MPTRASLNNAAPPRLVSGGSGGVEMGVHEPNLCYFFIPLLSDDGCFSSILALQRFDAAAAAGLNIGPSLFYSILNLSYT